MSWKKSTHTYAANIGSGVVAGATNDAFLSPLLVVVILFCFWNGSRRGNSELNCTKVNSTRTVSLKIFTLSHSCFSYMNFLIRYKNHLQIGYKNISGITTTNMTGIQNILPLILMNSSINCTDAGSMVYR